MKKIKQLQGLRGLAILGIFLGHTCVFLGVSDYTFAMLNKMGPIGVYTFFMLSGFFIGIKNKTFAKSSFKESIIKAWGKIVKLYPLLLITIVISFFAKFPTTTKDCVLAAISLPFHLTLTQSVVPHIGVVMGYNGPAWFLSAFFMIWVSVFFFPNTINKLSNATSKKAIQFMLVILTFQLLYQCIMLVLPMEIVYGKRTTIERWLVYNNPILCYSTFLLGICTSKIKIEHSYNALILQVLAILLLLPFALESWNAINPSMVVAEISIILFIASLQTPNNIGSWLLKIKILVWLGNISGYFFLIHGPINYAFRSLWGVEGKPYLFFASLGLSLFTSYIYQLYIEKSKR